MDFYRIKERSSKNGVIEVYPDFRVCRSKDLMVRGKSFYAIWDEEQNIWSTDEYDVQRLVDLDLARYAEDVKKRNEGIVSTKYLGDFSSNSWLRFRNYVGHLSDSSVDLDEELTFANTEVTKSDYVSRRLPYPLLQGDISAYDEIMGVLYDPEQRAKLEWAIGAIVAGDSKYIQKFIVLYGPQGSGKSTVLNIVLDLFEGYTTMFDAKALTGQNNSFATEVFRGNPLVAIQQDGDLSKIQDNTKLNSIVSHEYMVMNEKFKSSYTARVNAFAFMGTNTAVKITDAKSGIIRRLIDVHPSGNKVSPKRYHTLISQIKFELGAIAHHCLTTYQEMGKNYYSDYVPIEMMLQTDVFFNFIEAHFDIFREQDGTSLKQAYDLYKLFCEETNVEYRVPQFKFREELKNYFGQFDERAEVDGVRVRSWFSIFLSDKFKTQITLPDPALSLVLDETESIFDKEWHAQPAQYATTKETPHQKWADVTTTLQDIDTSRLHYVKLPVNHIVIDFDLKDADGNKSLELNLEAASKWPKTYSELSKGGAGIHLHYLYEGDAEGLSRVYGEGIEIKVFVGDSSLRRKLTQCNHIPITTISSGLPLKEKKVINHEAVKSEKTLRDLVERNLRKEIHQGTKPSMDFIHKILEDAYASDLAYDLTDLRPRVMAFANNSSNQSLYCLKLVAKMQFKSEETAAAVEVKPAEDRVVFFDCEVFPNLFVLNWMIDGDNDFLGRANVVRMINPKPHEVEDITRMKLVGFNCRNYDNHILYARMMGYNNEELYRLSQRIISGSPNAKFGEAYNLSYTDIYDFASAANKMALKKWQIKLGIRHQELGLPWDQPVPPELWDKVAEYCDNDVISTGVVFHHLKGDWVARQILAALSGLTCNDTTNSHSKKIIFGDNRKPQSAFNYTKLADQFPGYTFDTYAKTDKSHYREEVVGEGGYVYAEPGMYTNVAVLDVTSMHPTSIEQLNLFGTEYTKTFSDIKNARVMIKRGDLKSARKVLDGRLAPFLEEENANLTGLSDALKTVVNSVYGLTRAGCENEFGDPRNIDNIVAKRGALFVIDLKHAVQEKGFQAVHIKTDSIKIPDATQEIIDFVFEFGAKYGYGFEHETTYEKFCLVNKAVYIAKVDEDFRKFGDLHPWTATGAEFAHPYIFKTLFSKEAVDFWDMCETKAVTTSIYLDFDEPEEDGEGTPMVLTEDTKHFVGKVGSFVPIKPGRGGATMLRIDKNGKFGAVNKTIGYRWLEAEIVENAHREDDIDTDYFRKLCDEAIASISEYGDFEWFVS